MGMTGGSAADAAAAINRNNPRFTVTGYLQFAGGINACYRQRPAAGSRGGR